MSPPPTNDSAGQPTARFEPYFRLVRSLMPRASSLGIFSTRGELIWSSDTVTGPELMSAVEEALNAARTSEGGGGQVRTIEGNLPVYLCALRDEAGTLQAMATVVCRANDGDRRNQDISFANSLLAPALECLRRDFAAYTNIEELNGTVAALNRDLELVLSHGSADAPAPDGANDLQLLLQQTIEHLRAATGALLVPEKNLTLLRSNCSAAPDARFMMKAHRKLLSLAQAQSEPLIINEVDAKLADTYPYRVLVCALRSRAGRSIGMLALLREEASEPFNPRDAHIAQIIARKALEVVESSYDALSGLYTRPAFERRLATVVTEGKDKQQWCGLYIDVDQLHAINEKAGMHVGDSVLGQLGELFRKRLPPGAFGARISGDRFAVLLPASIGDAEKFAESLRAGAEALMPSPGASRPPVSISVGVAPLDSASGELGHLLAAAESACKAAKDRGRNRVEVYQASDVSLVRRFADISVAAQLREAIDKDRLRLDAQLILPLTAAESGRPHYELLLRMINDDGKIMGPDSFLAAAVRYQLMPVIDRWVVNHVIKSLKPRVAALSGKALGFTINFSGQSLDDDGFADFLIETLGGSGLDPDLFCFELTENATVAHLARAEELMKRLRKLGCGVALDDFGTGLSSFACLRRLPITMLKIDGSFVRDILKDPRAESMVRAIAELSRSMSVITVAEYIETDAIGRRVAELGIDYGQGFAIGRPIPFTELLTELQVPGASGVRRGPSDILWSAGATS